MPKSSSTQKAIRTCVGWIDSNINHLRYLFSKIHMIILFESLIDLDGVKELSANVFHDIQILLSVSPLQIK